jgi:HlyD family secretion protein
LLNDWKTSLSGLTSNTDISLELNKTKKNLETLKGFADTVALLINAVASNDVNSATQISAWRTDIAASRNTIISSMATIDTTTDELLSASLAVQLAQDELNLKRAGSTKEQIQLQELQISQAQASLENIEAQLNKTILRAPITSLVTKVSADVGEIVSPNTPFLLMISDNQYKVEVNAPEVEIAKIHLQDKAVITLDAYGDSINFEAVVGLIDPSETVIDSVPTYKTTLFFSQEDGRIKSGMTANITIITAEKQNVLVIPQRAIQRQNGKKYVQVLNRQKIVEEQEVTIGIVSSSGLVEILSGLGENQQVIIP